MTAAKRMLSILICLMFFSVGVYGAEAPKAISVYLKPDVTIMVGEQSKSFYNEGGDVVFPLIFEGTTYLPVRAVSSLMGENIEWDDLSKTVFIGRTLNAPSKVKPAGSYARDGDVPAVLKPAVQIVDAYLMQDIIIMYDFEVQNFYDINGKAVYPINYLGSNYLPVRAVSKLMGETVEWDAGQKLITISDKKNGASAGVLEDANHKMFSGFLADIVAVSDDATARIMKLQSPLTAEELAALLVSASNDSNKIDRLALDIRRAGKDGFTEKEQEVQAKLLAYAESAGFYILIIENIVYRAERGEDYSMFSDPFLNYALDAQAKYDAARDAIKDAYGNNTW